MQRVGGSTHPESEGETIRGSCWRIPFIKATASFLQRIRQRNSTLSAEQEGDSIVNEELLRPGGVYEEWNQLVLWGERGNVEVERIGSLNNG